jgi:uncharacterized surface protein with fasciclin (FAS1) repeats
MMRLRVFILTASLLLATLPFNVTADATDDIPTNATNSGVHDSLVAALAHADLVTTLQGSGPFTVFAPTDEAFAAAGIDLADFDTDEENATLRDILLYHVYSGQVESSAVTDGLSVEMINGDNVTFSVVDGVVSIEDATVTTADVMSSNGVIHIIDKVLTPPADLVDIPAVAISTGIHTALVEALIQADLVTTLQGTGPFTVFAPTDAAFSAAGIDLATFDTPEEIAALSDILLYHVVAGATYSTDLADGTTTVRAVNGDSLDLTVSASGVTVGAGNANVTIADVAASNGVVHVIDQVLLPPAGDICYNMVSHTIVAGADKVTCNSYMYLENFSMGTQTITGCYNSVTHAVTNVTSAECSAYIWTPAVNLAMTASATTIHTSLVAALTKANLVATISGTTDYTVFAPSDEAFAAAGINLDDFTTDEQIAVLADILLYHVVAGTTLSTDLTEGMTTVSAANGDDLLIHVDNGSVMIGSSMANVTLADVPASNGVIHVIDQVLTPPASVDPFEGVTCDVTIGIGSTGYAFSPAVVNINVGQTVCWSWEDESMPHNVKEITGSKAITFVENGITSGDAAATVAFSHTFTEDSTFYYACEPHVALNMFGEIVVGDGGEEEASSDVSDDGEDTPGFLITTVFVSMIGALVLIERRSKGE